MMQRSKGLTLIEVLIALAIVGIAMTAIIKASTQNIQSTNYIQNKTIATWVGRYVLNAARTGVLRLPDPPDELKDKMNMVGRDWYFKTAFNDTPNPNIKRIYVDVYQHEIDEGGSPLMSLETYIYKKPDDEQNDPQQQQ